MDSGKNEVKRKPIVIKVDDKQRNTQGQKRQSQIVNETMRIEEPVQIKPQEQSSRVPKNRKKEKAQQQNAFDLLVNFQLAKNSSKFSGEYEEQKKDYFETPLKAKNTEKKPLIPIRTPDCNRLGCFFQAVKESKIFQCCSKKQYNFSQMVLDWRLSAILKDNEGIISNNSKIILLNGKLLLKNDENVIEQLEDCWEQANWGESLQQSRNFIGDQLKQNCWISLSQRDKFEGGLEEGEKLYKAITSRAQFKQLKQSFRNKKNQYEIDHQYFKNYQKPGMFYIDTDEKNSHLYTLEENNKILKISVFSIVSETNKPLDQKGLYFRNNKNEICYLHKKGISRYGQLQNTDIFKQEIIKEVNGLNLSQGTVIVYTENILYVIGGKGCPKRLFQIKMGGKKQTDFATISGIINCERCKATCSFDGVVYILPQDKIFEQSQNLTIYRLKAGQKEIKQYFVKSSLKNKKILTDQRAIFSIVFQEGKPLLFLSLYQSQNNKCKLLTIPLQELQNGNATTKIMDITTFPKFATKNFIYDTAGMILANSSRYLVKVQGKNGNQIRQVVLSKKGPYFSWKLISF